MTDPLSFAAGIAGLISLTIQVAQVSATFVRQAKNASESVQTLISQLNALKKILVQFEDIVFNSDEDAVFAERQSTLQSVEDAGEYQETLERMREKLIDRLTGSGVSRKLKSLTWPFSEDSNLAMINVLSKHLEIFNSALNIDSFIIVRDTRKEVKGLAQDRQDQRRSKILQWLSTSEMNQKQSDIISKRQGQTGSWLIQHQTFLDWLNWDDVDSTIWCHGPPASGKTVLTSIVINHIVQKYGRENVGIAFFYCDYNDRKRQTDVEFAASLLKQLAAKTPKLLSEIERLYDSLTAENRRPSLEELRSLLNILCEQFDRTYIIVDALDEFGNSDERSSLLSLLRILKHGDIRIFVTSLLSHEDIETEFSRVPQIKIEATDADIRAYVTEKIDEDDLFKRRIKSDSQNANLQNEIVDTIIERASGMFLMAVLQLKHIKAQRTSTNIVKALMQLPSDLSKTYEGVLERIQKQVPTDARLAMRILQWLAYAEKPLLIEEISHALAVDNDEGDEGDEGDPPADLDRGNIFTPKDFTDVCAGLITIEEESRIVRLVHFTIRTYFAKSRDNLFPSARLDIARTCLTYLSFTPLKNGYCHSDKEYQERLQSYPFLSYAAQYWGSHIFGKPEMDLEHLAVTFLEDDAYLSTMSQAREVSTTYRGYGYSQLFVRDMNGLSVAAALGLEHLVYVLLERHALIEARTALRWTALHFGARYGHEKTVKLLVGYGADMEATDDQGQTPLHLAAFFGHTKVVQLLTSKGANISARAHKGVTPLSLTARQGNDETLKVLIEAGANHGEIDRAPYPALNCAAERGHLSTVRMLLKAKADIHKRDADNWTALHRAAAAGHAVVVQYLIEQGARVDEITLGHDKGALHWAAEGGRTSVVRTLLDNGADINLRDTYGETPVNYAIERSQVAVIALLLDRNASINLRNNRGLTPLSLAQTLEVQRLILEKEAELDAKRGSTDASVRYAALTGNEKKIRQLLEEGVDLTVSEHDKDTALHLAAWRGHLDLVRLITTNVDVDIKGHSEATPLHRAASSGHEQIVVLLLDHGANVNSQSTNGDSALRAAALNGHMAVVEILLNVSNIEIDIMGHDTRGTALIGAATYGHVKVVQMLLAKGADPMKQDPGHLKNALHWAAEWGHTGVVRLLLADPRTNVSALNRYLQTALHDSASNGFEEIVRMLLDANVNKNLRDYSGQTALEKARQNNHAHVVNMLL